MDIHVITEKDEKIKYVFDFLCDKEETVLILISPDGGEKANATNEAVKQWTELEGTDAIMSVKIKDGEEAFDCNIGWKGAYLNKKTGVLKIIYHFFFIETALWDFLQKDWGVKYAAQFKQ